jgi:divalent metal cation (Fe/Co/Zn/Cd) transporter
MVSEGVHSLVDTINELLLLYGIKRAAKAAGQGPIRSVTVANCISGVSSLRCSCSRSALALSFYEGTAHLLSPHAIERPLINYGVLAASFLFEGTSWWFTLKAFKRHQGQTGLFRGRFAPARIRVHSPCCSRTQAALIGLVVRISRARRSPGVFSAATRRNRVLGIGVVLAVSSILLARETKQLLIGEPAHPHVRASILKIAADDEGIRNANGLITVQLGPQQIVAALSAEFEDALTTGEIERCVNRLEDAIKSEHPDVAVLFVKPQTRETWLRRNESVGRRNDEKSP